MAGEDFEAAEGELDVHDDDGAPHELAAVRDAWAWDMMDEMNFYTRVLGGAWTKREWGVAADCVSGFARSWVLEWCRTFRWPTSSRFGFARFGRAEAHQLCREWCRRSEYFYQVYIAAVLPDEFLYEQRHIDEYIEDEEWLVF